MPGEAPLNPYLPPSATPPAVAELPVSAPDSGCYRDGDFLMVRDGTILPAICPFTGQPTMPDWQLQKLPVIYVPPWSYAFLALVPCALLIPVLIPDQPLNFLPIPIAIFIACLALLRAGKRGAFQGFVSPSVWRRRRQLNVATFLIVPLYVAFVFSRPGFGAFIAGIVIAVLAVLFIRVALIPRLRPVHYRDGWFLVKSCHPDFLARLSSSKD